MKWIALVSLLAGCDYLFNLDHIEPRGDAGVEQDDANPGTLLDAAPCVDGTVVGMNGPGGTGLLQICVPNANPGAINLTTNISTNTDCDSVVDVDSLHTQVCVKWGSSIQITGGVQTRGDRPLVVAATESIFVGGLLDLASHGTETPGAGSNWIGCNTLNGGASATGGGGGPGGSFGTRGGNGGAGGTGSTRPSRLASPLDRVRGGCGGGTGGPGTASAAGGLGGAGGGAVYLIAGGQITIDSSATINASGAGGLGGAAMSGTNGGGGGGGAGGSGGLIGLDAPSVSIDPVARLLANGGGGGAGGLTTAGSNGSDPTANALDTPAGGGLGGGGGGGVGAAGVVGATAGATDKSGGGGGGAAGYIVIASTGPFACGKCSPLATASP